MCEKANDPVNSKQERSFGEANQCLSETNLPVHECLHSIALFPTKVKEQYKCKVKWPLEGG